MKIKKTYPVYALLTLIGTCIVSITISTVCWFGPSLVGTDNKDPIDGQIGLRSYFYDGNGSENHPYEIVNSVHLYNLSRLQNLGIFNDNTYHFQMGHYFTNLPEPGYYCVNYDSNGSPTYDKYLDMADFCSTSTVVAVGGEGSPFRGIFDGKKLSIKNLTITGNPEDIGLFGYVASGGSVTNLTVENITIDSIGYTNQSPYSDLFGAEVEDLFNENGNNGTFSTADLKFKEYGKDEITLKNSEGIGGRTVQQLNVSSRMVEDGDNTYYDGFFTPVFPNNSTFDYSWRFSTKILESYKDANGVERARINLSTLSDSEDFNSGENAQIDCRIYLIANKTLSGYTYSRVMQSYVCEFLSNGSTSFDEGKYSVKIFCDHKEGNDPTYHHGNNIGYLAGHVDGTIKDCFVYNGTLELNNVANKSHISAESQTGLVGEVGVNVANDTDPSQGSVVKGDTGIMNFSGIYKMVRRDINVGEPVLSNYGSDSSNARVSFFSYNDYIEDTYTNYKEYLRHDDSADDDTRQYISTYGAQNYVQGNNVYMNAESNYLSYLNRIDFLNDQVIEDTKTVNRGLGVFKIATAKSDTGKNGYLDKIGNCQIVNGNENTKIYFSTAEYDHMKFATNPKWNSSIDAADPDMSTIYYNETMDSLPTYGDSRTWNPILERDVNFNFELDLSRIDDAGGNNFLYNNDSDFLTEYLKYKLIDKNGDPLKPGDKRFGFMLRDSAGVTIDSISSYMPVNKPSSKFSLNTTTGTKYYPSNSIVFSIDNPNGANVSVVAAGDQHATIYKYNPNSSATTDIQPLYSMFSKTHSSLDSSPYFSYDPTSGQVSRQAVVPSSSDRLNRATRLYAHIFKLPKGDYCIGSQASGVANIYMLAVQGQTDGTVGEVYTPTLGDAVVEVDFLIYDPEEEKRREANFSFKLVLTDSLGTIVTDCTNGYISISFDNSNGFVDSLLTYDRNITPYYEINGVFHYEKSYTYRGGGA